MFIILCVCVRVRFGIIVHAVIFNVHARDQVFFFFFFSRIARVQSRVPEVLACFQALILLGLAGSGSGGWGRGGEFCVALLDRRGKKSIWRNKTKPPI